MLNQKKVTDRRIFKPIRMLSILFLAVLIPVSGYTADLNADFINAVSLGEIRSAFRRRVNSANFTTVIVGGESKTDG